MNIYQMLIDKALNGDGGGGGSLEMETGTASPSEQLTSFTINFKRTHSQAPAMFFLYDDGDTSPSNNGVLSWAFYDFVKLLGGGYPLGSGVKGYGRYVFTRWTSNAENVGGGSFTYPSTNQGDSTASYPRFFAKESSMKVYTSGYYFRATRSYKWIAIWI